MGIYTDAKLHTWYVSINLGTCKRVKEALGFDFLASEENSNPLLKLASDYLLLADVLWEIVKPEAIEKGVSVEAFVEGLSGDSIDHAVTALANAYINFIPNPQRREILLKMWEKVRETETVMLDKAAAEIEAATFGEQ